MLYLAVDLALHHGRAIIVLDVALPSSFIHEAAIGLLVLLKSLLAEVLNRVVVSVSQEVINVLRNGVVLQFVHQARAVALYLLGSRNCEENNFSELLRWEGPENATS